MLSTEVRGRKSPRDHQLSPQSHSWRHLGLEAAQGMKLLLVLHLPGCEKNRERRQSFRTLSGTAAPRGGSAGDGTETKQETGRSKGGGEAQTLAYSATSGVFITAAL